MSLNVKEILTVGEFNPVSTIYVRENDVIAFTFIFQDRSGAAVNVTEAAFVVGDQDYNSVIEKTQASGITLEGNQATLEIDTASLSGAGQYLCQLSNGNYVISEIVLKVQRVIGG